MNRTWQYLVNPFLAATTNSFALAQLISNHHLTALQVVSEDPFFKSMYEAYLPLYTAYEDGYSKWKAQAQQQTGQTDSLNKLLKGLKDKVEDWDTQVKQVHKKDTSEYKSLLGAGRKAFTAGTQANRIASVKAFAKNLKNISSLKYVWEDVEKYGDRLAAALNNKDSAKKDTGNHSDSLEAARVAICNQQYAHLGLLINKYADKPEMVEKFFDTSNIRTGAHVAKEEPAQEKNKPE